MVMGVAWKVQIRTDISIHYDELPSTATLPLLPSFGVLYKDII